MDNVKWHGVGLSVIDLAARAFGLRRLDEIRDGFDLRGVARHRFPFADLEQVRGERVHIQYDDGDREWTKAAALVLPVEPLGPDARPTKVGRRAGNVLGWVVPVLLGVLFVLARASCR